MKWKDFFFFSKSQQIGIIILIVLILLVTASIWIMPYVLKPEIAETDSTYFAEARKFRESLTEIEQSKPNWDNNDTRYQDKKHYYKKNYQQKSFAQPYELFEFDPNLADSTEFVKLGLSPYIAANIIKYRNKGGTFRNADDFSRIYGINSDKFTELEPFIKIHNEITKDEESSTKKIQSNDFEEHIETIEINTADETQFIQLPGLGKYTAYAILRYRKALGGFHSIGQLKEVEKVRAENYEKFAPYCIVDKARVKKININTASIEKLKRHPYIGSFQRAKAIYEYRRYKINLNDISELKAVEELSEEDMIKLKPYLKFE